jgi:glyoxylase-like metal-dependent hydrolase (beta-lactamase superfamily II)/8-oxo-dGTP pyrophosphatase MutT (NUDIX family)
MAALRECFEEAGLLFGLPASTMDNRCLAEARAALNAGRRSWLAIIESLGVTVDLNVLVAFDKWTTPAGLPKRFATQFYALVAPAGQAARPDQHEMTAAEWVVPAKALAEADTGQRWLMPPTRATLRKLQRYGDTAGALAGLVQSSWMAIADIQTGVPVPIAAGLQRLTAPNPSPMTGPGTNSYIVGHGPYVVIDPGVDDESHLKALLTACENKVAAICLTHRHPDHVGGTARLAERTGAPVRAWPKAALSEYDQAVAIDQPLADGETLTVGGMRMVVRHTPGHAADHIAFELPEAGILLAGDTLMTDATVVILPPDGDMGAYFATLDRLVRLDLHRIAPGHGRVLPDPIHALTEVTVHRRQREAQVVKALSPEAVCSAQDIAEQLYPELDPRLKTMAAMQIRAHLLHLEERGKAVQSDGGWCAAS